MGVEQGLRERKKARTRRLLADTAARLFAERGYDAVSMADVGRAAEVSDQTVYNYFPAKQDLVLDMADEFRERYRKAVLERPAGSSPASALRPMAHELIEVYRTGDPDLARGELPALTASSATIRRHALEMRAQEVEAIADAIARTTPGVVAVLARTHAAALVAVFQAVEARVGRAVHDREAHAAVADELEREVGVAMDDLDDHYRSLVSAGR